WSRGRCRSRCHPPCTLPCQFGDASSRPGVGAEGLGGSERGSPRCYLLRQGGRSTLTHGTLGILTSHPDLLGCQLVRLDAQVQLAGGAHPTTTVGLGTLTGGEALLRRWATRIAPHRLAAPASALLYCAQALGPAAPMDEDVQPLRFGSWLFSTEGELESFPRVQAWVESELPPHLLRAVGTRTVASSAFALFLASLRTTDPDRPLAARDGARRLAQVGRVLALRAATEGAARSARLLLLATDGQVLLAARVGDVPARVALLEGTASCVRCGIQSGTKMDVQVRGHLRARAVAVTSLALTAGTHWLELPD